MSVEAGPSEFSTIVNEGPVSLSALENTMTIAKFNPVGEIAFKPSVPSVIEQAEAVAAAAWEKSEPIQQEVVLPVVLPGAEPLVVPQTEPVVLPRVEPAPELQVSPAPKTETGVFHQAAHAISPQPLLPASPELQRGEQEQVVEEEVLEKIEPEDSLEEEEEETEKRLFLEDEKALAVRKFEIKQAVKLAKLSTIVGSVVARFLPGEHQGNRSQALHEKGPDGSYEETVEAIASSGEFSSTEQAEKRFEDIVAENKPVKNGKEGNPVTPRDVLRVFKYRAVKPSAAVKIYAKRIVKKQAQVLAGPVAEESKTETSLENFPELAEVFEKAA